ncbi:MAG: 30S ribosomal protein S6 [Deltaproteobacteria bacterium]|nr:30S ribosomal protein S6 [Deltaproteobacteria bacterium]
MRHYETLFIINPELSEEDTQAVIDKFAEILTSKGATMGKIDPWGRRRLAYLVKKFSKGFFVLFDYGAPAEAVEEMERNFKIDEAVIRFLTVKLDGEFDPEAVAASGASSSPGDDDEETPRRKFSDDSDEEEDEDDEDDEDDDE